MKKSLFSLAMALCIGLFASCSQEEIISGTDKGEETVNVSAQLPDNTTTRALPGAAEGHQLRCILEVWNKDGNSIITRIEKLASEATGDGKLQFSFTVPSATNYQCLLWADFIAQEVAKEGSNYPDKYYSTTNLKAIDFKLTDANLFNNASTDAFCGVVEKNGTTSSLSVTLKRPFTKLTLTDKSDYLASCTSLAPSFKTPSGYDISTGKAIDYTDIAATGITPTDKTLFSTFIFAPADKQKLDQEIKIEFTKQDGSKETKTIKADQITLDPNKENNAEANFSTDSDVTVDVDINDEYHDPNALKIGQFVNKDGSVTDVYSAEAIGILFAVGAQGDDAAANYEGDLKDKTIAGYAMALSCFKAKPFSAEPTLPAEAQETALTSFSGMKLTNGILAYITANSVDAPLFTTSFDTWKKDNTFTGVNLSSWYVPSYQQLVTFIGYIFGVPTAPQTGDPAFPNITKNDTFAAAVATASAGTFDDTSAANVLSSSFTTDKKAAAVQITNSTTFTKTVVPGKLTNAVYMRPVLTVFKADAAK